MASKPSSDSVKKTVNNLTNLDLALSRLVATKRKYELDIKNGAEKVKMPLEPGSMDATMLVRNLHGYIKEQQLLVDAEKFYNDTHDLIEENTPATKVLMGGIGAFFASSSSKENGEKAYNILSEIEKSEYGKNVPLLLDEYKRVHGFGAANPWTDFNANSAPYYALLDSIVQGKTTTEKKDTSGNYLPDELIAEVEAYELKLNKLHANLRRYQYFGTQYILHQKKVLLGDEMGLGKTMQAIASFCHLAEEGMNHFLVVCPLSVVVNWTREIETHSDLKTIEIYSKGRDEEMQQWVDEGGVGITTFETLNKVPVPEGAKVDMLVVDEAHYIKNPKAQRTMSVMAAMEKSERALLMSGTPMENKVEEMNFLISLLQPEIIEKLDSATYKKSPFYGGYTPVRPTGNTAKKSGKNDKYSLDPEEYKRIISPVYIRRVREDVLKELPELIEKEEWGNMNSLEREFYVAALGEDNFMAARQLSWHVGDMSNSTKALRLKEISDEMKEMGRKIIIFSFFKSIISNVSGMLGEDCAGIIDGSVPSDERQNIIDKFSAGESGHALVCQVQAAGVGLNIQAASVIIFCEPQLKPSMETQAIARAYRMGQSQSVLVHRLLIKDSIDERIMDILHDKTVLFDNYADESVVGNMSMDKMGETAGETVTTEVSKALMSAERERYQI